MSLAMQVSMEDSVKFDAIEIKVPLTQGENGTILIEGTRVPLDTLVYLYREGATPEEAVDRFSTLDLADVYHIFAFYLQHKEEVDAYINSREVEHEALRRDIESRFNMKGIRERLLARKQQPA
jgi:uncharacterized protein (DUF433 family)